MKSKNGFTLVELIVVLVIIIVVVGCLGFSVIGAGLCGNQYYTQEGLLENIRTDNPTAKTILRTHRNVFRKSEILVEQEDGTRNTYLLDSNILFNYKLTKK